MCFVLSAVETAALRSILKPHFQSCCSARAARRFLLFWGITCLSKIANLRINSFLIQNGVILIKCKVDAKDRWVTIGDPSLLIHSSATNAQNLPDQAMANTENGTYTAIEGHYPPIYTIPSCCLVAVCAFKSRKLFLPHPICERGPKIEPFGQWYPNHTFFHSDLNLFLFVIITVLWYHKYSIYRVFIHINAFPKDFMSTFCLIMMLCCGLHNQMRLRQITENTYNDLCSVIYLSPVQLH